MLRQAFAWARPGQYYLNSEGLESLDLAKPRDPITCITLIRLEDHNIEKLKELVRTSPLQRLLLSDCFHKAEDLGDVLRALAENNKITKLFLKLQDNACDLKCIREIKMLLSREVIQVLILPQGLDEYLLVEVLQEIFDKKVELRELDISRSVINDDSLDLLKNIILSKLIRNKLVMTGCEGVANTTLTTKHKETLEDAVKSSSRFSLKTSKLHVAWFTHVLYAREIERENDDDYEICEIEDVVRPVFHGKLGSYEKIVRLLIRRKGGARWQLLRNVRKRTLDSGISSVPKKKVNVEKVIESDIDKLSDQIQQSGSSDAKQGQFSARYISGNPTHANDIPMKHEVPEEVEAVQTLSDRRHTNLSESADVLEGRYDAVIVENDVRRQSMPRVGSSSVYNPRILARRKRDISGYAIYQRKTMIKLALWTLPDGEELQHLRRLDDENFVLINTSEFQLTYGDKKSNVVTMFVVTPYRKDLVPSKSVTVKKLLEKKYFEIDYTIPDVFLDASAIVIEYMVADERGRFRVE